MTSWIRFTNEDIWGDRIDTMERFLEVPQPTYVLPGPGIDPEVRYMLVSDTPWTADTLRTILEEIEPRAEVEEMSCDLEDPREHGGYDVWVQEWIDRLAVLSL